MMDYIKTKKSILLLIVLLTVIPAFTALYLAPIIFLTVTGNSMEPVISEKDVVVVLPLEYSQLEIGDIIAYRHLVDGTEFSFTHRIVEIVYENDGLRILTKGDALSTPDDYSVRSSQVIGTVVFIIPLLGAFLRFANSLYGLLLLIIIPASLLICGEVRKIIRYKRKCEK